MFVKVDRIVGTEKQVKQASVRALNKTATWLRSQSVKEISRQKRLQQKIIRSRINITKAKANSLEASVVARLHGVKAPLNSNGSFVATMPRGYKGIFKRKGKSRLPIHEVLLPLEPVASNIIKGFASKAADKFEEYFRSEFILSVKI